MDKLLLSDYVKRLIEDAVEAHEGANDDFSMGRKLALYEVLSSLQNILVVHYPEEIDDYGLNFNIDRRFLTKTPEVIPLNLSS
ncbi:MAG: hypothetical protein LBE35_04490 [Clostridiales bacterium]|nr:hypothetical protein [Clostridiales bacterium]